MGFISSVEETQLKIERPGIPERKREKQGEEEKKTTTSAIVEAGTLVRVRGELLSLYFLIENRRLLSCTVEIGELIKPNRNFFYQLFLW